MFDGPIHYTLDGGVRGCRMCGGSGKRDRAERGMIFRECCPCVRPTMIVNDQPFMLRETLAG